MKLKKKFHYIYNVLGTGGITYLFRDDFLTAESAPLSSPRTNQPIGEANVTDPDDALSVSGGSLIDDGSSSSAHGIFGIEIDIDDLAYVLAIQFNKSDSNLYPFSAFSSSPVALSTGQASSGFFFITSDIIAVIDYGQTNFRVPYSAGQSARIISVLANGRGYVYYSLDGSDFAMLGTLLVDPYPTLVYGATRLSTSSLQVDTLRVAQLQPSLFEPSIEIASPSVGVLPDLPDADFVLQFELTTIPSSGSIFINLRQQDSNNAWRITATSGTALQLRERVSGADTIRGGTGSVLTNGMIITFIFRGNTIRGYYDNTLAFSYTSAKTFLRDVGFDYVSDGTGGVISDLNVWKGYARNDVGLSDELISNGDFGDGLTDWLPFISPSPYEVVSGRMHIAGDLFDGFYQEIATENGYYEVSFDYEVISGSMYFFPEIAGSGVLIDKELTGSGTRESIMVFSDDASADMRWLCAQAGSEFYVDNITLKKIEFVPDALGRKLSEALS